MSTKSAPQATLTLHNACNWTDDEYKKFVSWMRDELHFVKKSRKEVAKRYTARLLEEKS